MNRESMRKFFFWFGWTILILLPIAFTVEIFAIEDLPEIQPWKWALLFGAVILVYFTRNRDDALKHHVI